MVRIPSAMQNPYFIPFNTDIQKYSLPNKFTFPFSYEPHPLTQLAVKELQLNFQNEKNPDEISGKMYGVLIVQSKKKEIGYLAAFSGQDFIEKTDIPFVPPIYNRLDKKGFYKKGEQELVRINNQIKSLEKNKDYKNLMATLKLESRKANDELKKRQLQKQSAKANRKEQREKGLVELTPAAYDQLDDKLRKESINEDYDYKNLNKSWKNRIAQIQSKLAVFESQIQSQKKERKKKSAQLQKKLFNQYQFLNIEGKQKSLEEIFEPVGYPPSGAGDCALPKLLQYAFANDFRPLAMAEFWWGKAPKSELRKSGRFYPACSGKCKPILRHMLQGMDLEDDPLLKYTAEDKIIETLYEDEHMAVIVKPAGLLSIPAKEIKDSVLSRMQEQYPEATGPLLAHRLDKLTSGIMLISKSLDVHKGLQSQFMNKTIEKKYHAVLEKPLDQSNGEINLPIGVDEDNRPMQKVDYEKGREAITKWSVLKNSDHQSLVEFIPLTGRTHQLRVHAAHPDGLDSPIVGDPLYGQKSKRLMLHAAYIKFLHPASKKELSFEKPSNFRLD